MARQVKSKANGNGNGAAPVKAASVPALKDEQPLPGIVIGTTTGSQGIEQALAREANYEIGATGLAQFSGIIFQEPLTELRGREAYKRYDEMRRNSPIISALLLSIENPIRSTDWEFASDNGNDDPRLDLLNEARENLEHSFNDHISEILTFLPFGFSIFEPVYEQVDGKWFWRKFAPRSQNTVLRWIYEEIQQGENDVNGSHSYRLAGFEQLAPPKFKLTPIPIERLVIYRLHDELDNPEGRSALRAAWIPYFYIKHLQQIEAIGAERDLAGLPVIHLPPGATTDNGASSDFSKASKLVRNVRNDEQSGLVVPDGWAFELLRGAGTKQFDVDKVINRYEKRILTSALAQFLMLGQEGIGALALSKDQTDFFTMSVNAVADIIASTFTKYCIPPLMKLNGYDADGLRLEHTPAQGETGIQIMAAFLKDIGPYLHITPEDEVWLRQVAGMPEKTVEELQALDDKKQAEQDAANAARMKALQMQQGSQQPGNGKTAPVPSPETNDVRMLASAFGSNALDEKERARLEKKWAAAFKKYQAELKKKVVAGMKDLR